MKANYSKSITIFFAFVVLFYLFPLNLKAQQKSSTVTNENYAAVEKTIHNAIGWAVDKDFDLFFNTIADDSSFISVTPYDRVKFGVEAVSEDTAFWASPHFKAVGHELHHLKINFSQGGDVAWFFCILDDFNTWKGQPANWEKVRWTGVLEKRQGQWRIVQHHFSWPREH